MKMALRSQRGGCYVSALDISDILFKKNPTFFPNLRLRKFLNREPREPREKSGTVPPKAVRSSSIWRISRFTLISILALVLRFHILCGLYSSLRSLGEVLSFRFRLAALGILCFNGPERMQVYGWKT